MVGSSSENTAGACSAMASNSPARSKKPFSITCSKENALQSSWIQRLRPAGFERNLNFLTFPRTASLCDVAQQQRQRKRRLDEMTSRKIKGKMTVGAENTKSKLFGDIAMGDYVLCQDFENSQVSENSSCSGSTGRCEQSHLRNCLQEIIQRPEAAEPSCRYPQHMKHELDTRKSFNGENCSLDPVKSLDGDPFCTTAFARGQIPCGISQVFAEQTGGRVECNPSNQDSTEPAIDITKDEYITRHIGWKLIDCPNDICTDIPGNSAASSIQVHLPRSSSEFLFGFRGRRPCPLSESSQAAKDWQSLDPILGSSSRAHRDARRTTDQQDRQSVLRSQGDQLFNKARRSRISCETDLCCYRRPQLAEHEDIISGQVQGKASGKAATTQPHPFFSRNGAGAKEYNFETDLRGFQRKRDENMRISYILNYLAVDEENSGKENSEKPRKAAEQLLGADKLFAKQGSDHNYVLTPIFEKKNPVFSVEKQKRITVALQNERAETLVTSEPKTLPFSSVDGVQTLGGKFYGQLERAVPSSERKRADVQNGSTSNSSAAKSPRGFASHLSRRVYSLDPWQTDNVIPPYKDVCRAQSSSTSDVQPKLLEP